MAKELPYFKFEPAGWKFGRIQKRSDAVKIAFIDICCKYWHDECVLSVEDAELDFGQEVVQELIKFKVIKVDEGFLRIHFLDIQLTEIEETASKNSMKGKLSAKARAERKKQLSLTAVESGSTEAQPNATNKSRVDEIKEEDIIKQSMTDVFLQDLPNSRAFEKISMNYKVSKEELKTWLTPFKNSTMKLQYKDAVEFAEHFKNWYLKQDKTPKVNSGKGPKKQGE